jgi:hypothetical protein
MMTETELDKRFKYHAPKGDQASRYEAIRQYGRNFAEELDCRCPDSREKSLALTKLQEAIMWANASIACNE